MLGMGTVNRLIGRNGQATLDNCLVCHRSVREDEERILISGRRYVHRSCSTYRMRQRAQRRR